MGKLGQNVFAILSSLHEKRKLVLFSKTITELYTPLIWRHLRVSYVLLVLLVDVLIINMSVNRLCVHVKYEWAINKILDYSISL